MTIAAVAAGTAAVAGVAGAAISASNAKGAAGAQTNANQQAAAIQAAGNKQAQAANQQAVSQSLAYLDPYKQTGDNANNILNSSLWYLASPYSTQDYQNDPGYTPMVNSLADLQATPGYQFQLEQGMQGVNNSATAKGSVLSGSTLKAVENYGQGLASTSFNDAWNRAQTAYQNAFSRDTTQKNAIASRLGGIAGQGQNAATGMASTAMGGANNAVSLATGNASNQAQYAQNQGNINYNLAAQQNAATQQGLSGLTTAVNTYAPTLGSYLNSGTNTFGQNNAGTYFGANNQTTIPQYNWG